MVPSRHGEETAAVAIWRRWAGVTAGLTGDPLNRRAGLAACIENHTLKRHGRPTGRWLMLPHNMRQMAYLQRHNVASAAVQHTSNCVYGLRRRNGMFALN
jgi:hypothetical protein